MTSLSDTLAGSLGVEALAPPERLAGYSIDGTPPEVAVFPADVGAVSEVLSLAAREGKRVTPWGGGTQVALGNTPTGVDLVLGTGRLNRVLFHEPADMVAGVEAGITLEELQEELARNGQFLPLEAPLPSRATIGGILAANASGPSRLAYGTARDWLIGIKVVQSDGTVTKSGGRVVKNVTGYDLNKLYTGSLGTLGVLVEATFKVAPLPPDRRTLVSTYPSISAAMDSAYELLRQSFAPHALQVINRAVMARLPVSDMFGPVSDAFDNEEAAVLALFSGRRAAVERKIGDSARVIGNGDARTVESLSHAEAHSVWQAITDMGWAEECPPRVSTKVSVLPSQVGDFVAGAGLLDGLPSGWGLAADVGSGLARLLWWAGEGSSGDGETEGIIRRLREEARRYDGHVVVERCPPDAKKDLDVWGDSLEGMAIMRRIKRELDPAGILNPGRFAGRI